MGSDLLARGRALLACALLATATGAASCSRSSATVSVSGRTLTIYVSAPAGLAGDPEAQDTVDAERLAFEQLRGEVNAFRLRLRLLTAEKVSDNARTAIEDQSAIAYLGELQPGASADSVGITNAEDLLQVAPTDTYAALTRHSSSSGYYESYATYGQTFARMVPTSDQEAKALLAEMQALGVRTVYVTGDGSAYGRSIAAAVRSDAPPAITVAPSPAGAGAVFYGGGSATGAARLFNGLAQSSPGVRLFAPSALDDDAFAAALSPAAQRDLYVSSPGFAPSALPPRGRTFAAAFRAKYGHSPAPEAIFGYEAMSAVLAALREPGAGASSRATVVSAFLKLRRSSSQSVIGAYAIDRYGDLTGIAPFVFNRVRSGKLIPVG